jgi:spermidine synthase
VLIIGLGAGLSARALHAHGYNTTINEIDPVVYEFARKFFGVPEARGGTFLEDARLVRPVYP